MANTNDHLMIKFVKESIEERFNTYGIDHTWFSEKKLKQTLASVLREDSVHYYQLYVKELCELSSDKAVRLESLTQQDLKTVWEKVVELWPPMVDLPDFAKTTDQPDTNAYIFCKSNLGGAQNQCVDLEAHIKILEHLYGVKYESLDRITVTRLLSLCLWALFFYTEKKEKGHKTYNSTSHAFHSDLVICFIALRCRFTPVAEDVKIPPKLPEFKNTIIHYGISPQHPAFHRLVLQEMLKMIMPDSKLNNLRKQNAVVIAEHIYWCLHQGGFLWSRKGSNAILLIISDQSRYMALRQPGIRRNYVADKTRRVLSAATRIFSRYDFIRPLPALRDNIDEVLYVFNNFMIEAQHTASWDDGSMLPPLTEEPDTKVLNFVHHMILTDICTRIPGYHCPQVDENGRFEDADFNKEVRKLANTVVELAIKTEKNDRPTDLYPVIADLAVALQLIIAARWYISEVEQRKKVTFEADKKLINHQEVVFIFLAFRAIMMYILGPNSYDYDVQEVAVKLPSYAKELRFYLPLLFLEKSDHIVSVSPCASILSYTKLVICILVIIISIYFGIQGNHD